jgi:prevent-host-death family protein
MLWQVQEAKQRFSELLRAAQSDGPQIVTRHGEEIAVLIDIAEFHRLRGDVAELRGLLVGGPRFGDEVADVFAAIEAERKADLGRVADFEVGRDLPA